jgi:hypothetical protein
MFDIKVTAAAKAFLDKAIQELDLPRPGAVVYRQGAKADVTRSRSGKAVWDIEHPHPWAIELGSFETFPDNELVVVDGIKFHLALIPMEKEAGATFGQGAALAARPQFPMSTRLPLSCFGRLLLLW